MHASWYSATSFVFSSIVALNTGATHAANRLYWDGLYLSSTEAKFGRTLCMEGPGRISLSMITPSFEFTPSDAEKHWKLCTKGFSGTETPPSHSSEAQASRMIGGHTARCPGLLHRLKLKPESVIWPDLVHIRMLWGYKHPQSCICYAQAFVPPTNVASYNFLTTVFSDHVCHYQFSYQRLQLRPILGYTSCKYHCVRWCNPFRSMIDLTFWSFLSHDLHSHLGSRMCSWQLIVQHPTKSNGR